LDPGLKDDVVDADVKVMKANKFFGTRSIDKQERVGGEELQT